MVSLAPFKVGLIANLGGGLNRLGNGILSSAIFGIDRYCQDHPFPRNAIQIEQGDDHGQAASALTCAQKFFDEGAIAVIGPADSHGAELALSKADFGHFPFVITSATATRLAAYGTNMFRTTNNDSTRADELVGAIKKHASPDLRIAHFSLAAPNGSYAHGLGIDVENALKKAGVSSETITFSADQEINDRLIGPTAMIISAPSLQAAALVKKVRDSGYRGSIFAFGSNSNFLKPYCRGLIVISDLDRASEKASIRQELTRYALQNPIETEPSLATMNGAYALADAIAISGLNPTDGAVTNRQKLHRALMTSDLKGMFGPIRFLEKNGELIGVEYVEKLQVSVGKSELEFSANIDYSINRDYNIREKIRKYFNDRPMIRKALPWIAGTIAVASGMLGIATDGPSFLSGG